MALPERLTLETYFINYFKTMDPYGLNTEQQALNPILPMVVPFSETAKIWTKQVKDIWDEHIRPEFYEHLPFKLIPAYSKNKNLNDILCKSKLPKLGDSE